jgi:hypothetical protein
MNTLRIFLGKILPLSLLMPALIVTHFFADCSRAEKKSIFTNEVNKSLHSRSLNIINDLPDRHKLQNNLAAGEKIINYDLIVKDIIRIFKWLDSDSLKPIFWNNFIRGQYCESSCQLIIEDPTVDSVYKGGSFAGMVSNKYLSSILIYLNEDNSKVIEVSIILKKSYSKAFEVAKIYPMLTNEKFVPLTGVKLGGCDGPCRGGSRDYRTNINDKYFPRSVVKHNLRIVMGVDIISGIGKPRNSYKLSKEILNSINLRLVN